MHRIGTLRAAMAVAILGVFEGDKRGQLAKVTAEGRSHCEGPRSHTWMGCGSIS